MTTRRLGMGQAASPRTPPVAHASDREAMIRELVMEAVRTALRDGAGRSEDPREYLAEAVREVTLTIELLGLTAGSHGAGMRAMLLESIVEAAEEIGGPSP